MIYIHVPFCHRKCTYCAFYSVRSSEVGVRSYVDALLEEMKGRCHEQAHPIRTVYFGGGTPSILPLEQLERIVKALRDNFDLSQVEEVTIECNPEDLTKEYLRGLKDLGLVNRLSIGIQSLDDNVLRMLNRRHTAAQAIAAVENAHAAGFGNISVDFIYGLPERSEVGDGNSYLITPISDLITHVSAYALTVEPGTALAVQVEQGRVALPDEDEVVRQYHVLRQRLEASGFEQYEVSNYARPGYRSRHNSRYWNRTPYLGLGPGAHSFAIFDNGSTSVAHVEKIYDGGSTSVAHVGKKYDGGSTSVAHVEKIYDGGSTSVAHVEKRRWNNPDGTFEEEMLTPADAYNELLMTALRTTDGLAEALVPEQYKERLHRMMQPYIDCGWIVVRSEVGGVRYVPTPEGLLHADGMAAALFV